MVIFDRLAKGWAVDHLRQGITGPDFGLVDFTLVHNMGAAFGMGQGAGIVFVAVAVVVWLVVGKRHGALEVVSLALVVAGGIGNCIDRLTTGYVVDFIRLTFIDFPVFNVADICVTCGVVLFLIALIRIEFASGADAKTGEGR